MPDSPLVAFQEEFLSGKPAQKDYVHFSEVNCHDLDLWIGRICRSVSLEFLHEILFTILNELLVNGCKANAKRVFFREKSLNLQEPSDYKKGISLFKFQFGHHRTELFRQLENTEYLVNVIAKNHPQYLEFKVSNNAKILEEERNRINQRILASEKYKNINDAYKESVDSEESSGLGIVLIHILLRNSGVKEKFFELKTEEHLTTVTVRIPKLLLPIDSQTKIRNILTQEVESLPPLSAHIQHLIREVKKKDSDWHPLAEEVKREPAVTAEILKIANSPLFGAHQKVILMEEALKRIGLKNLESILLTLGARKILNGKYDKQIAIWSHSFKVSLYVRFLGEQIHTYAKFAEVASVSGLLHDIGRMVLLSLDLSLVDQIRVLKSEDNTQLSEWVEEYTLGITHSEIGYMIGKKWNFPEEILDVIRFHHKPWLCRTSNEVYCRLVYLSDIMASTHRGKGNYYTIEPEVLSTFGIYDEKSFQELLAHLKRKYESKKEEYERILS
ncbi:HDOD domain protein [Leptospira ryugenii]|uniref:HDOD domain protein n=1 Tax=Leptospira ryugenii TaxID=1917863 RepID=A0A2P2E4U1_9LEPT|nr:HDOD domain-containing protein [Leptospira ryugenii]GBF51901.1 HDOD domain protein [Leptospira ryugenii]